MAKTTLSQEAIKKKIDTRHVEVKNWQHLHSLFESTRDSSWIFRGVTDPTHYLVPSIGREKVYGHYKLALEQNLFNEFKKRAFSLVSDSRFTDWDWLAYAQHIAVPTRLLDWSSSPLVATFFALDAENDSDRVVYASKYSQYIHEVQHSSLGPLENKKEGRFTPALAFDRLRSQRGVFTVHPDPTKIFDPPKLESFLIKNSQVQEFRKRLFKYGIDHWLIYPDMKGLGQQMSWQYQNKVGLGSLFTK